MKLKTSLKQIDNKRTLVYLYKDVALVTCVHIFCTALFTNNNLKVVIQIDAFLAHQFKKKCLTLFLVLRPQFCIFKKKSTDISSLFITPLQTQTNYKKIYGKKVTKKCKNANNMTKF